MTALLLRAPLAGWAMPLDQVDDPVFSDGMMGDGVAIDPLEGLVTAPAAGQVIALAPTGHSITLRLDNGAELLIHIGLETVALGGAGFEIRVENGSRVEAGDPMIAFDMDRVSRRAKSLVTPVVILSEGYRIRSATIERRVARGDPIFSLEKAEISDVSDHNVGQVARAEMTVPLPHGIHARPAAQIAGLLKSFVSDVRIRAHGREANARSTGALLTLGVKQSDPIELSASGDDADAAVRAVRALIASGMGEAGNAKTASFSGPEASDGPLMRGVCAAPGLAAGHIVHLRAADVEVSADGTDSDSETRSLREAMAALHAEMDGEGAPGTNGIALAHRAILDDPELEEAALREIGKGRSAAFAWRTATRDLAERVRSTGDAFLIERIDDLVDVERRMLGKILDRPVLDVEGVTDGAVLIADTLLPSEFMALSERKIGGIATARGGPTSHVAILAASAGVPMLVAVGERLLALEDGRQVVLDATAGTIDSEPSADRAEQMKRLLAAQSAARVDQERAAQADCAMADGTRIEVFANLGSVEDAGRAVALGAEGCGLLRTEFLFLDRTTAPTEDEQRQAYADVARALGGRPLIVRTLDIGGDKPVPYLDAVKEDNPALGRRGVRLTLARPEILATQLRAILSGVPAAQCRIMVPMIVDVAELRSVRALLDEAKEAVGVSDHIPLGVMIETPSAAVLADSIAAEADFLSVGTNDLSQYVLAVDRGNPALAGMVDALHPAVLRMIGTAADGAAGHGRWLGVCGGLASDPKAAAILIGLGVTELSAVPAAVPAIKAAVRRLTMERCRALSRQALTLGTAKDVRALLAGEQ